MSYLVVDELKTTLTQTFTIEVNRRIKVAGIRPLIVMNNSPAGTFTLSLKSGATTLASQEFDSAEIKSDLSTSDDYAYLWKRLVFDNPVQISKGDYDLVLSSSGYTFSDGSYLGWIKEYDNVFNEITGGVFPNSDWENPFSFQLFELREQEIS